MSGESLASHFVPVNSAASAFARGVSRLSRSPKMIRCSASPLTTVPSLRSIALICAVPPITRAPPNRASSVSKCASPFSSGTIAASPVTAGAMASIAESRSYALHVKRITS